MTIRKGEEWGRVGPAPQGLVVVSSDSELFRILNCAPPTSAVGLVTGDLARTLGAGDDPDRFAPGAEVVQAPIDVGVATHEGGTHRFVCHAVARRSWWRGPLVGAFNAQFLGTWDVAPRAHPNDGFLDLLDVDPAMSARQRWAARSRLATASHVPHPNIRTRRARQAEWTFAAPMDLWLDGVAVGRTRTLCVRIEPEPLTVYV